MVPVPVLFKVPVFCQAASPYVEGFPLRKAIPAGLCGVSFPAPPSPRKGSYPIPKPESHPSQEAEDRLLRTHIVAYSLRVPKLKIPRQRSEYLLSPRRLWVNFLILPSHWLFNRAPPQFPSLEYLSEQSL